MDEKGLGCATAARMSGTNAFYLEVSRFPASFREKNKNRLRSVLGEFGRAPCGTATKPTISILKGASKLPAKTVFFFLGGGGGGGKL